MTADEFRISSVKRREKTLVLLALITGLPGGDGAQEETDGRAGLVLDGLPLFEAFADQQRMREGEH
jgi:hypothetical protein